MTSWRSSESRLGHMALQYARKMGFKVVAIGRGSDIADDAKALGAHYLHRHRSDDPMAHLQRMGGAHAIVSTIGHASTVSAPRGLAPWGGRLVLLGAGKDPLPIAAGQLVVGERASWGRHRIAVRERAHPRFQRAGRHSSSNRDDAAGTGKRCVSANEIRRRQVPHGADDGALDAIWPAVFPG